MITNRFIHKFKKLYNLTPEKITQLKNSSKKDLHSGRLFKDANVFLNRLYHVRNKPITIYGDYDVDGVMSSGILYYAGLELQIGKPLNIYYPNAEYGFGLSVKSVDLLMERFPDTEVIITTDNGTAALDGVKHAHDYYDVEVLVTDHHEQEGPLPKEAGVVVNPNRIEDDYPFKSICGTTVIWKLLLEYAEILRPDKLKLIQEMSVFVGIATVADMMALLDENRFLIKTSLFYLNQDGWVDARANRSSRYQPFYWGLKAILTVLEENGKIKGPYFKGFSTETIGYYIGPMINAPRRVMGDSSAAYRPFFAESYDDALIYARELYEINETRKKTSDQLMNALSKSGQDKPSDVKGKVVQLPMSSGYAGIVAGRVMNKHNEPVIALAESENEFYSGSARSPIWYDLLAGLKRIHQTHPHYLHYFGGHKQAGGLGVYVEYIDEFRAAFESDIFPYYLAEIDRQSVLDVNDLFLVSVDSSLAGDYLDKTVQREVEDFLQYLTDFEPFGQGFPPPEFILQADLETMDYQSLKEGRHGKWNDRSTNISIIKWNVGNSFDEAVSHYGSRLSLRGFFQVNVFRGNRTLQFIVNEFQPEVS